MSMRPRPRRRPRLRFDIDQALYVVAMLGMLALAVVYLVLLLG